MDPVSAAASVVNLVQLAAQVFGLCTQYYLSVKDARRDIQRLSDQLAALSDVLEHLATLSDSQASPLLPNLQYLSKASGPIPQCMQELRRVSDRLNPSSSDAPMKRFGSRSLKWPFGKLEVDKLIESIERYKSTFNLALTADNARVTVSIGQGLAQVSKDLETARADENRGKIIRWLSDTDPSSNHIEACRKHQALTGEWLTQGQDMQKWKNNPASLLWLHGKAGCGKTILSSTVIEHLKDHITSFPGSALAYYYFDFNDAEKQKVIGAQSSILGQLCASIVELPEQLIDLYNRCNAGQHKATLQELTVALKATVAASDEVFVVLDALDECPRGEERTQLLRLIEDIDTWSPGNFHLLVTSRLESDIEEAISPLLDLPAIRIGGSSVADDIKLHVQKQLSTDPNLKRWDPQLKNEIETTLVSKADGMFRWVYCQLEALKKCLKPSAVRRTLDSLPKTLDETYARILLDIDEMYEQEAMAALRWLVFADRPLSVDELAEASVVSSDRHPAFDPDERFPDPEDILTVLTSLVMIAGSERNDRSRKQNQVRMVQLAHYSVKEYLLSTRVSGGPSAKFGLSYGFANYFIAESCLLYLLRYAELYPEEPAESERSAFPLLRYASQYWDQHRESLETKDQDRLDHVVGKLFFSDTTMKIWLRMRVRFGSYTYIVGKYISPRASALYYAARLGLIKIVRQLLDDTPNISVKDGKESTALHGAAFEGRVAMAKMLLDEGFHPEARDAGGRSVLSCAAWQGQTAVVELLLKRGVDFNSQSTNLNTALSWAAGTGQTSTVKLLLDQDGIQVNIKNSRHRTAFSLASAMGHLDCVALLLPRSGPESEHCSYNGRTPLSSAAGGGHLPVVELLLRQKSMDVNAPDDVGNTPLIWATEEGHTAVVELLLRQPTINIEAQSDSHTPGQTSLSIAAKQGYSRIVALLLAHNANPNTQSHAGRTPLSYAAANASNKAMLLLLAHPSTDPNLPDTANQTPLHCAILRSHARTAVQLVQHCPTLDPNTADTAENKTPLSIAAERGNVVIVQALLAHPATSPDLPAAYGQTPLAWAAVYAQLPVMRLLLAAPGVDADSRNDVGRTPLSHAASRGYVEVCRLLLETGRIKADSRSDDGRTPLAWAAAWGSTEGHLGVAALLVEREDVDLNAMDNRGRTPRELAEKFGHKEMAELLRDAEIKMKKDLISLRWDIKVPGFVRCVSRFSKSLRSETKWRTG